MTFYVAILFCIIGSAFFTYFFVNAIKYGVKKNVYNAVFHGIFALFIVFITCLCIYSLVYMPKHPPLVENL